MDLIRLPQFPSVAAGGISTLVTSKLIGKSIYALILERSGTSFLPADINNFKARLDGKDLINGISGTQLQSLNTYDGIPAVTNYSVHYFGDPTARTIKGQHFGDLDCSVYQNPLEIEVDIAGTATAPKMTAYALVDVPKSLRPEGYSAVEQAHFRHIRRTVIQPSAAVVRDTYGVSLGSAAGGRMRKIGFFHNNLTSVELRKASYEKWDDISIALNSMVASQNARVPQAGLYVLDRVVDGNQGEAETTLAPDGKPWLIEVMLTTSAGDTITAFADMHSAFNMI